MELDRLEKYLNWRVFFMAVACAVALRAAPYIVALGRMELRQWNGRSVVSSVDRGILSEVEQSRMLATYARYRRLSAMIEDARLQGFSVEGLQAKADEAMRIAQSGFRREADEALARIELQVPSKKVQYIPLFKPPPKLAVEVYAAPARHRKHKKKK